MFACLLCSCVMKVGFGIFSPSSLDVWSVLLDIIIVSTSVVLLSSLASNVFVSLASLVLLFFRDLLFFAVVVSFCFLLERFELLLELDFLERASPFELSPLWTLFCSDTDSPESK